MHLNCFSFDFEAVMNDLMHLTYGDYQDMNQRNTMSKREKLERREKERLVNLYKRVMLFRY